MYGESSVQESFHAAETLKLLSFNEYDFIGGKYSTTECQLFRKRILECIISTDMALMKQLRGQLADHLERLEIKDGNNADKLIELSSPAAAEKSKQLVSNSLIHACDISTSLRQYELSTMWADLLFDEFFGQGDMEKSQGLEVSMMCDRKTTKIASGQAGFIQFIVMPIFSTLSHIVPVINDVQLAYGDTNIEKWKVRTEAEKKLIEKEEKMKQLMSEAANKKKLELAAPKDIQKIEPKDVKQMEAKVEQ